MILSFGLLQWYLAAGGAEAVEGGGASLDGGAEEHPHQPGQEEVSLHAESADGDRGR